MRLRHIQNIHYQFELGLYDEEEYENQIRQLVQDLDQTDVMKEGFCQRVTVLSPRFVTEVHGRLATPCD